MADHRADDAQAPIAAPVLTSRLAFGAERLGLAPLAWPRLCALAALLATVIAAFGVARLKVDDSLSQLFRSDSAEFRQYEELTARFPSSEYDVLVVVEADDLLAREKLTALRELVTDLQLAEGVRGLVSLFSARNPVRSDETPPPLFPEVLPEGEDYAALVRNARENEIVRGKLLSEDGKLALIVLSLDEKQIASIGLERAIGDIRRTA